MWDQLTRDGPDLEELKLIARHWLTRELNEKLLECWGRCLERKEETHDGTGTKTDP